MTTSKRDDEVPLRDPRFETAWRAASSEEPPAALDAAIAAAARREVGAGPQPVAASAPGRVRRHWWPLAAAATIGVITAGVLQLMPHDELVAPGIESRVATDMPATPATSVPPAVTPAAPVEARKDTATGDTAGKRPAPPGPDSARPAAPAQLARKTAPPAPLSAQQETVAVPPTVAALPDPFPAAPPMEPPAAEHAAGSAAVEPARARSDAAAVAKLASEPVPAAPSASGGAARSATDSELARPAPQARIAAAAPRAEAAADVRAKDRAPLPVAEWIALIRRLRAEGKTVEAARELAAFRLAHADHERLLPADLREWRPAEK